MAAKKKPSFRAKLKNHPFISELGNLFKKNEIRAYLTGQTVMRIIAEKDIREVELLLASDRQLFFELLLEKYDVEVTLLEVSAAQFVVNKEIIINVYGFELNTEDGEQREEEFRDALREFWFTCNALAISLEADSYGKLIDPFGGYDDTAEKIIRAAGDPHELIERHPLASLFAGYLSSEFQFIIDEEFISVCAETAECLADVPQAELTELLLKILGAEKPSAGLIHLFQCGLMQHVFSEAANLGGIEQKKEYDHKDVFYHTCEVIDNVAAATQNVWVRFAALVHDIAKPPTKKFIEGTGWTFHGHEELGARMMKPIFKKLELPPDHFRMVRKLVRLHLRPAALAGEEVTDSAVRRLITDAGDYLNDLILLCRADITSKNISKVSRFQRNYDFVEQRIMEVKQKDELAAFQSPVRGEEIMKLFDIKPSRKVGTIKKAIEDAILSGEIENTYEAALRYLLDNQEELLRRAD